MKKTNWHKKIALFASAAMLLVALPVQASSNSATAASQRKATGNVIDEGGATSKELPGTTAGGRSDATFYVEEIPFTVSYKPVDGENHAPEQTFKFILEPKDGAPLPKLSDTAKNKSNAWYAEEVNGKIQFTVKMSSISDGKKISVNPLIDLLEFNDPEKEYVYSLYQQIPKSGDSNYSAQIDQNAQGGRYDTTTYTIRIKTQVSNGKRQVGVSVFRGSNDVDKTIPEFINEYKPPVVEETPPPPPETPPTVLGAIRELPQVLGAMRDAIMTGDTSALTIATVIFAGTCLGLAAWLAAVKRRREGGDDDSEE